MALPSNRWAIAATTAAMLAIVTGQPGNGLSVFSIPMEREFGWSRGSIALINTVGLIGVASGGVAMGRLADRAGIRAVCLTAALATGLCITAAAFFDRTGSYTVSFANAAAVGG